MAFQSQTEQGLYNASDPYATYLSSSLLDLLLVELVPLAYRTTAELALREESWTTRPPSKRDSSGGGGKPGASNGAGGVSKAEAGLGIGGIGGTVPGMDEDETREAVFYRLEGLGYRVGLGIVERFSRDRPRLSSPLDAIKFLCKDLWILLFRKQIDNLKTNHRGIYVLTDNTFKPLTRISHERGRENANPGIMQQAQPFLYFPVGVIRGALKAMGIDAVVQAETAELPGATFQIRTVGS